MSIMQFRYRHGEEKNQKRLGELVTLSSTFVFLAIRNEILYDLVKVHTDDVFVIVALHTSSQYRNKYRQLVKLNGANVTGWSHACWTQQLTN